jgi:hypothetical protein
MRPELVEFCSWEGADRVTLEAVPQVTSRIPGSMAQAIVEEE